VNQMRDNRILIGTEGPLHNVLKIRPPMPFSLSDADHFLTTLEKLLST
jgi:4-aminobutyrate aminotransferase-like enzyme